MPYAKTSETPPRRSRTCGSSARSYGCSCRSEVVMRCLHTLKALTTVCLMLAWASRNAPAQTVEQLFDSSTVQDVFISINERDLTELRDRYRENVFFPADVVWRGVRVQNI